MSVFVRVAMNHTALNKIRQSQYFYMVGAYSYVCQTTVQQLKYKIQI